MLWIGSCKVLESGSSSEIYKALHEKGFASVVGFKDIEPVLDEPRLARYFFYYGTRHAYKRSVSDAFGATVRWRNDHLYDKTFFNPQLLYDSGFTCVGYPSGAYFNW